MDQIALADDQTSRSEWNPRAAASFWINVASRLLLKLQDARLHPLGFGINQMPVLQALSGGPRTQKDLAHAAGVEQPTMAEMVARMERAGIIRRKPNPADGRGSLISLTPRSRFRLPKAKENLIEVEAAAVDGFSSAEKEMLLNLLRRVVKNLQSSTTDH